MVLDNVPHLVEARPLVVARTRIVHIAAGPLHGVGPRTRGWEPEHRKARRLASHGSTAGALYRQSLATTPEMRVSRGAAEVASSSVSRSRQSTVVWLGPRTIDAGPGRQMEGTSQRGLCVLAGRPDCLLAALGHPGGADLRPTMASACIGKDH